MKKISKGNLEGFNLPKHDVKFSLDDREWDEFKLEDLFEIERGKRLIKKDRLKGNVPYMSASEINNGITDKISNPLFIRENSLCLTTFGDAFYHKTSFTASDEITMLKNKHLNNYTGLFLVSILQHQKYRYSFGRKLYYNKIKYIDIKLPIKPKSSPDEKSEPDWEFMEDYIKDRVYKVDKTLCIDKKPLKQDVVFKNVNISDLFNIGSIGKDMHVKSKVNVVSSTVGNNGVSSKEYIEGKVYPYGITITSTSGVAFVQAFPFITRSSIALTPKYDMSINSLLYIATVINFVNKGKYSWGNSFSGKNAKSMNIKIPVLNGKPDLEYMDNYINNIKNKIIKTLT